MKREDLRIRDPYVVAHDGVYYLYGTNAKWTEEDVLYVYKSRDLKNWSDPVEIYRHPSGTWAKGELWAPEVHLYRGKFYMLLSLLGNHGKRGTQIFVSDTPDGKFTPISNSPATPYDRSCIDGTLYVENGTPFVVYSADWPDNLNEEKNCYIGEIRAIEMSEDLTRSVGDSFLLFRSNDSPASYAPTSIYNEPDRVRYGSDGPFLSKLSDGSILLTWSPIPERNYVVAAAVSDGGIRGKWRHLDNIFSRNGGHAMFFHDFDGSRKMVMHYPEEYPKERAVILNAYEKDGTLVIEGLR